MKRFALFVTLAAMIFSFSSKCQAKGAYGSNFVNLKTIYVDGIVFSPENIAPEIETREYIVNLSFLDLRKALPSDIEVIRGSGSAKDIPFSDDNAAFVINVVLRKGPVGFYGSVEVELVREVITPNPQPGTPFLAYVYLRSQSFSGVADPIGEIRLSVQELTAQFLGDFYESRS